MNYSCFLFFFLVTSSLNYFDTLVRKFNLETGLSIKMDFIEKVNACLTSVKTKTIA